MSVKHELMRNTNTLLVLDHIRQQGETTRRSIQQATDLSWAAVSNITSDLIARNILCETQPHVTMAGRNPGYLNFVPMQHLTIGLELNAVGLTVLLLDLRCGVISSRVEPFASLGRDYIIAHMLAAVDSVIQEHALAPSSLLGIGIAMQGTVDSESTMSRYNSFFQDWQNVPLKEICEKRFQVPVHVMHDPICIALAEQWQRKLTDRNDFCLMRLSYGIGMCYINRGHPISGHTGSAGELGHMVLNRRGPVCSCGNRGCMESYCSLRGIAKRIQDLAEGGKLPLPPELEGLQYTSSVQAMKRTVDWGAEQARQGNKLLKELFQDAGYYLGIGIANIVNVLNPEYVILTGDMMDYRDLFLEEAEKAAARCAWDLSSFKLVISEGSKRQAAIGAALYFINEAFGSQDSCLLP